MSGLVPEEYPTDDLTSQISDVQLNSANRVAGGSFGDVYRCTIETSVGKTEVAVKVFKVDPRRSIDKLTKAMRRELGVSLRLNHPGIVPLLGIAMVGSPLPALVSQWMSSGTLSEYLERPATFTPSIRYGLVEGIAEGLTYIHSEGVIHGDIHPKNILIDDSGSPRLADFGLATVADHPDLQWNTTTAGHLFNSQWRAPEVLGIDSAPQRPIFKSDIYSFGSVISFIISGDVPWKGMSFPQIIIELWKRTTPVRLGNISHDFRSLIRMCWSWKPEDRPEARTVLQLMVENRQQSSNLYDHSYTASRDVGHSKAAPPLSKKPTWEQDDPTIKQDTEAKKVREWRRKLQKALLRNREIPAAEDMPALDQLLTTIENYNHPNLIQYLAFSKIAMVMRLITTLPSENVPRDDEFMFRRRAQSIIAKWDAIVVASRRNENAERAIRTVWSL